MRPHHPSMRGSPASETCLRIPGRKSSPSQFVCPIRVIGLAIMLTYGRREDGSWRPAAGRPRRLHVPQGSLSSAGCGEPAKRALAAARMPAMLRRARSLWIALDRAGPPSRGACRQVRRAAPVLAAAVAALALCAPPAQAVGTRTTTVVVSCGSGVVVAQSATCTVTVTDTAVGTPSPPTGDGQLHVGLGRHLHPVDVHVEPGHGIRTVQQMLGRIRRPRPWARARTK